MEGKAFIVEAAAIVFLLMTARFWLPIVFGLGKIALVLIIVLVVLLAVAGARAESNPVNPESAKSERMTEWLYHCKKSPVARISNPEIRVRNGIAEEQRLDIIHYGGDQIERPFTLRLELINPNLYNEDGLKVSFLGPNSFGNNSFFEVLRSAFPHDQYVESFDRAQQHDAIRSFVYGDLFNKYKFFRGKISHVNIDSNQTIKVTFADCELLDGRSRQFDR